jgi:protein-S-isoprenylcysteine O-methyltransferase Ste14
MPPDAFNRLALAAFLILFWLLVRVLPTARLRRRAGISGFVAHLAPSPVHRLVAVGGLLFSVEVLAWIVLYGLFGPGPLDVWRTGPALGWLGWALMSLGVLVIMLAQAQMGLSWRIGIDQNPTSLVTRGLFGWVRNPIFTGILIVVLGLVAVTPSPWTLMVWAHGAFILALQVRLEEAHLLVLHGQAYRAYTARVGRFIPGIGLLESETAEGEARI